MFTLFLCDAAGHYPCIPRLTYGIPHTGSHYTDMLHLFTLSAWVHTPATGRRSGCHIQPAGIITAFATFPHSPAGDTYLCCTLFLIWVDYWKRLVETEWKHVYLLHSEWSTSIVYLSAFILIGEDFRIYFQRYPGRTFQYQQSVAASLVRNSSVLSSTPCKWPTLQQKLPTVLGQRAS